MTKPETSTDLVIKSIRKLAYDMSKQDVAAAMRTDTPTGAMLKQAKETADKFEEVLKELAEMLNAAQDALALNDRLADLLTRTVNALRGPPPKNVLWSWHDVPDLAATAKHPMEDAMFAIIYDDTDRKHETIRGEKAARKRFSDVSLQWNAHLFVKVESNARDDPYYQNNIKLHPTMHAHDPADPGSYTPENLDRLLGKAQKTSLEVTDYSTLKHLRSDQELELYVQERIKQALEEKKS